MIAFAKWAAKRAWCFVRGHRMTAGQIYYPPAAAVVSGYHCTRCGKTQLLLRRWQEADAPEVDDD